jgi:hypothetical protein
MSLPHARFPHALLIYEMGSGSRICVFYRVLLLAGASVGRAIQTANIASVRLSREVTMEEVQGWSDALAVYHIQLVGEVVPLDFSCSVYVKGQPHLFAVFVSCKRVSFPVWCFQEILEGLERISPSADLDDLRVRGGVCLCLFETNSLGVWGGGVGRQGP